MQCQKSINQTPSSLSSLTVRESYFQLLEKTNKVMAPKQFACCYFPADCGAVVLEKKKLALRSDFKPLGEIDVKFTIENEKGEKETVIYFGQILKILTGNVYWTLLHPLMEGFGHS